MRLVCPEWQVDFVKMAGARFRAELVRLAAGWQGLHLLQFCWWRLALCRLTMPGLCFEPCGALATRFRQVIQYPWRGERQDIRRAIFDAGRALRALHTEVALVGRGFHATVVQRRNDDFHRAKRAGHHAGFATNAFLLIHLYAVIVFADSAVRAALRTGRILTMVAGDGAFSGARLEYRNAGMKMALAQDMLLVVVRHDTGDFASTTSDTLLAVGHNKTIHNYTCFGFNNLILYMNIVFTECGVIRQCSNAQEAKLFTVNLWQINLFHSG